MTKGPRLLELLAPARDYETARQAIDHGADAVYIGPPSHGARASASNSLDDIARACDYAHRFRARVYATVNTLIYDNELKDVERLIRDLYRVGVDALIVQDMAVLKLDIPPIALHASTQCDARTPEKALRLQRAGFSQIVLPRELSQEEIRRFAATVDVPLEAFVHGALCVCYSGDCRASLVNGGRSANRGQCAQICRLPYDLVDDKGNVIIANRHLLSLRDLNRLNDLASMADAGISSFKIEGRLKSVDYVKNTVAAYSRALDSLCAANPDLYHRASAGRVTLNFNPDVNRSFNRGFTRYFYDTTTVKQMASTLTPKWVGEPVGAVVKADSRRIKIKGRCELHNGDGLVFFDREQKFNGFRVNRVEGDFIFPASEVEIEPGTKLYRNSDKALADLMATKTAVRQIPLDMTLSSHGATVSLKITDAQRGCVTETTITTETDRARSPQGDQHLRVLSKLGGTIYTLDNLTDNAQDLFIRASELTELRRRAIETLDHAALATRSLDLRRDEQEFSTPVEVDFHENIANRVAEDFYRAHGTQKIERTLEVSDIPANKEIHVMTTRYCLRRENNACLKTAGRDTLPRRLFLRPVGAAQWTGRGPLRLDFDCANCQMLITSLPAQK